MSDFLHIVCPQCNAINRVPAARSGAAANCGKCKQPLFLGHPLELTSANFTQHMQRSDSPLVIDFWAPWCGPCRNMAPVFAQAAKQLEPTVRLAKLDTEAEPAIAAQFNIRSIPTLAIFKGGREQIRQAGALDLHSLVKWVRAHT